MIEIKVKYVLIPSDITHMDRVLSLAIDKLMNEHATEVVFEFNRYKYKITRDKVNE